MIIYHLLLTLIVDKLIKLFLIIIVIYEVLMRVALTAMVFISDKRMFSKYYFYFPRITSLKQLITPIFIHRIQVYVLYLQ